MYVKMPPSRFGAMSMRLVFEFDGYGNKASVAYAALGNNMLSEAPDIAHSTLEHRDLQATVVIQVDVHRRDRQIMVVVKGSGQALRRFPFPVIIDVYKRRHAKLGVVYLALHVGNSGSSEIADRLGPVLITKRGNNTIECRHKLLIDGDGDPLHRQYSLSLITGCMIF
jgi:hypothetical protein